MLRFLFLTILFAFSSVVNVKANTGNGSDTTKLTQFTEGILHTRITFPGNPMNEWLYAIDISKGDLQHQLTALLEVQNTEAYAQKMKSAIDKMTPAEQQAMGSMMMTALMSPLYATIYFDKDKALAKAFALNYKLESFMNTIEGSGKMIAIANDNATNAAIKFSAVNLQKAWQKESVDATHYSIQWLDVAEKVSGIACKKAIYAIKAGQKNDGLQQAQKLIVWYTPQISNRINFAHPFYLDLPYGILKIEVFYDSQGKNRMVYEVTAIEQKRLQDADFEMPDIQPVLDWDTDPVSASMKMLGVFMSGNGGARNDRE